MTRKSDFLQHLNIESIRLRSLKVSTHDELYNKDGSTESDFRYRWRHRGIKINDGYTSFVVLDLIIKVVEEDDDRQGLFDFSCSIEAVYHHKLTMDKKLFNHLSKNLFVIHFWPYVRELIQNITYRIGMKPIVMPTFGHLLQ